MNGAIAVPLVNTTNTPNSSIKRMIGNNQNFFLVLKNPHRSFRKSISSIPGTGLVDERHRRAF
jgi:hypothetical protein